MVARKDKTPEPLYHPRNRKCSRVRLDDWLPTFDRASVGNEFAAHKDEIPMTAVRNMAHRIGVKLDKKFTVCIDGDFCYFLFVRVR